LCPKQSLPKPEPAHESFQLKQVISKNGIWETSYLSHTNPLSVDGKMEVAARGDADETLGQDFLEPGTRGSDGQL
jgi:hypothetical protein